MRHKCYEVRNKCDTVRHKCDISAAGLPTILLFEILANILATRFVSQNNISAYMHTSAYAHGRRHMFSRGKYTHRFPLPISTHHENGMRPWPWLLLALLSLSLDSLENIISIIYIYCRTIAHCTVTNISRRNKKLPLQHTTSNMLFPSYHNNCEQCRG